jgi:hypothetical protein
MEELFGDHRHHETALGAGFGGNEGVKADASHGAQNRFNGTVRQRLLDAEQGIGWGEGLVLEQSFEGLDLMLGPMGEIGQGAFDDLVSLPRALSQQNGRSGVSIGYSFDIHGNMLSEYLMLNQEKKVHLHGNKWNLFSAISTLKNKRLCPVFDLISRGTSA